MNDILRKLDRIGERLWNLAALTATQAAALEKKGIGIAIVAEETHRLANEVIAVVEKATLTDKNIDNDNIKSLALQLNFLALNNAIEVNNIGQRGKPAAVCAEEIRKLANSIVCLFDNKPSDKTKQAVTPWPANPLSTVNDGFGFLLLNIGGIQLVETLSNVIEILAIGYTDLAHNGGSISARNREFPLVDGYKMLGISSEESAYVIVNTPWAEQNNRYAVAAHVTDIFYTPIGKPVDVKSNMPLAKYVRECWENENGEPFYFMDWTKMTKSPKS